MGIFSGKKTLEVSSTIYNVAGEIDDRPNFLKTNTFGYMITDDKGKRWFGEALTKNYLEGPGIKQRSFFNWGNRTDFPGMPDFVIRGTEKVDGSIVSAEIPVPATPAGLLTQVQSAVIADGDFSFFTEKYMLENYPDQFTTDWTSDYDKEAHEFVIQLVDLSTITVPAGIYDPNKKFVVAYYYHYLLEDNDPTVEGDPVTTTDASALPDTSAYTITSTVTGSTQTVSLDEVTTEERTYSDSTPPVTTTSTTTSTGTYADETTVKEQEEYVGSNGQTIETNTEFSTYEEIETRVVEVVTNVTTETNDMGMGVTETVVTTVETDTLVPSWTYTLDTQNKVHWRIVGGYQMFIYELGGANAALNALSSTIATFPDKEFFPFIPLRIDNDPIDSQEFIDSGLYAKCKTAYRKSFGKNGLNEMLENIEDNESVDDIDFAYLCSGIPLNVKEEASRKYLYAFFKKMIPYQKSTAAEVAAFPAELAAYEAALVNYETWLLGQEAAALSAKFGTPRPDVPIPEIPEITTLEMKVADPGIPDFDMRISFYSIGEEFGSGLAKVDAKEDEIWIEKDGEDVWRVPKAGAYFERSEKYEEMRLERIVIYHQLTGISYRKLTIHGLFHENFVYGGKSVKISAHQAIDDEDESGFLLPMHNPTVREMSIVDYTQMATANTYIVFNSYEVVKQKWYQSALFTALIIIVIVVISVMTFGTGSLALSAGLLGTNIAVGTALGLTGTAAIVAGAAVNALAALIVSRIITFASKELFGDQIGGIIAAVVNLVVTAGLSGGLSGMNFAQLLTPQNLLSLTGALANGYTEWMQGEVAALQAATLEAQAEYEEQAEFIQSMLGELGGITDLSFNPLALTDIDSGNGSNSSGYTPESLDEFIHRTTLTGSDIVDTTLSMVEDFPELSLQLPKK